MVIQPVPFLQNRPTVKRVFSGKYLISGGEANWLDTFLGPALFLDVLGREPQRNQAWTHPAKPHRTWLI
jgi:hypothetical protein